MIVHVYAVEHYHVIEVVHVVALSDVARKVREGALHRPARKQARVLERLHG